MSTQRRSEKRDITFTDPKPIHIRKICVQYVIIAGDVYTWSWFEFEIWLQVIKLFSITNCQHQYGHGYGQSLSHNLI